VRHEIQFYAAGVLGIGVTGAAGTEAFNAAVGLNSSDQLMQVALTSCTFSFKVSEKIEFEGPVTMTPAGGGVYGQKTKDKQDDTVFFSGSSILTNGVPDSGSIYVLPLPVAITKRQGIQMIEKKFNMGTVNVVTAINEFKGAKLLRAYIDGYNTRDVL
jgi:hypothetical protein